LSNIQDGIVAKRAKVAEPRDGFSIRAVARMASVEPDTLRMWERRYGFPKPSRTAGGARVYSAADVETLRLIARAQQEGFRAGETVGRQPEELRSMLAAAAAPQAPSQRSPAPSRPRCWTVDELLDALMRYEVGTLRTELRRAALMLGPKRFVTDLASPLVGRLGDLWEAGALDIHQEHLMSELLSTQLRLLLNAAEELGADKTVLLATPSGELHELGLEMVAVYLAYYQIQPRLVGVDTPASQIIKAAKSLQVDAIGLTISSAANVDAMRAEVEQVLRGALAVERVWLGGGGAARLGIRSPNLRIVNAWSDLDDAITDLRTAGHTASLPPTPTSLEHER